MTHFVYILECADKSLYVGCTNNLERRLEQHNNSKWGAHYTKIRRPVKLKYSENFPTLKEVRRREAEIKGWRREKKLELIKKNNMKILITGIPGTGKTSIGNYLEANKGFVHFDMEDVLKTALKIKEEPDRLVNDFLDSTGDKKVITWGFIPEYDNAKVRFLLDRGYTMIWFDGDRSAALREFLLRGDVSEKAFNNQLEKIQRFNLTEFNPIHINTFDNKGVFLSKEEIVGLIFKKIDSIE